jgi:hypothetical protein
MCGEEVGTPPNFLRIRRESGVCNRETVTQDETLPAQPGTVSFVADSASGHVGFPPRFQGASMFDRPENKGIVYIP